LEAFFDLIAAYPGHAGLHEVLLAQTIYWADPLKSASVGHKLPTVAPLFSRTGPDDFFSTQALRSGPMGSDWH